MLDGLFKKIIILFGKYSASILLIIQLVLFNSFSIHDYFFAERLTLHYPLISSTHIYVLCNSLVLYTQDSVVREFIKAKTLYAQRQADYEKTKTLYAQRQADYEKTKTLYAQRQADYEKRII